GFNTRQYLRATVVDGSDLQLGNVAGRLLPRGDAGIACFPAEHPGKAGKTFILRLAATVSRRMDVESVGQDAQYAADVSHGGEVFAGEVLPGACERRARANGHHGGARE